MSARYCWVIRHAKSADGELGQRDHDRPLNKRGHRNGAAMQAALAARDERAEWIWSSTARRAHETAEYVARAFDAHVETVPELYLAHAETILEILNMTPPDTTCAAVVGHNPGFTTLTNLLAGKRVTDNLPTFGCALFRFEDDWASLAPGRTTLVTLLTPKSL